MSASLDALELRRHLQPPSLTRAKTHLGQPGNRSAKPGKGGGRRGGGKLARSSDTPLRHSSGSAGAWSGAGGAGGAGGAHRLSQSVDLSGVLRQEATGIESYDVRKLQFAVEQLQLRLQAELTDKERRIKRLSRELNDETHRLLSLQNNFKRAQVHAHPLWLCA